MNPYSDSLKRCFENVLSSKPYELDSAIDELMETIKEIDNGKFLKKLKLLHPLNDIEDWLEVNVKKGYFNDSGYGINLPINKDEKLGVITQIFVHIWEDTTANDFVTKYFESMITTSSNLCQEVLGIFSAFQGNTKVIEKVNKNVRRNELASIRTFHQDLTEQFERLLLNKLEFEYKTTREKIIMGDNFEKISNSVIINRNKLNNVLNRYDNNDDLKLALDAIKKIVVKSRNEDAINMFNDINEELLQKTPRKSRLKAFWNELTMILPSIKKMTDITVGLTNIFQ